MVIFGVMQKQASPAKKKRGRAAKTNRENSENLFLKHGVLSGMRKRQNENILGFDLPRELAPSNNGQVNQNSFANEACGGSKQSRKNDVKLNIRLGGDLKILKTDEYRDMEEMSRENSDSNYQSGCEDSYNDIVAFDKKLVAPDSDIPDEVFLDNNPTLIVPPSSTDLLLSNSLLLSAFEVYETLRRFHQQLRLTPFKIEDFCFVLQCNENTQLLSEIHISLLKLIIKGEETAGYSFTPSDSKTSFDLAVYSMDEGTWPAMVLEYIMSLENCPDTVTSVVMQPSYPFVSARSRLIVLQTLAQIFVELEVVRKELASEGQIIYDIKCSRCGDGGNLLCCDNCPSVYHLQCIKPPLEKIPENQWLCPLCECNQITGANDVSHNADSNEDFDTCFSVRNEMLGYDRHLRRYWFIARRLVIECYGHLRYYSQIDQVNFILESLDASSLESVLHAKLLSILPEIQKQMALTAKLTEAAWNEYKNEDQCETQLILAADITHFENFIDQQTRCSRVKGNSAKENFISSEAGIKCSFMDVSSSHLNCSDSEDNQQFYLESVEPEDEFYIAAANQDSNVLTSNKKEKLFCLGMEETSMSYVNFFTSLSSTMLKSSQWRESDDKKRFLGYKFCLNPELRWSSSMVGSEQSIAYSLKQTLKHLEDQIPATFLLDSWYEKFPRGVNSIVGYHPEPYQILVALRALESSMKPSIFLPVWRESCSQLGLCVKLFQSKKDIETVSNTSSKDSLPSISINKSFQTSVTHEACQTLNECINDDYTQHLSDAGLNWPVFVSIPLKHNLYKFKGELYRQKGNGWVWKRRKRRTKIELSSHLSPNEKFYQLPKYRADKNSSTSTVEHKLEQPTFENSFSNRLQSLASSQLGNSLLSILDRRLEEKLKEEIANQNTEDPALLNMKSKLLLQISEVEAETTLIKSLLSKLNDEQNSLEALRNALSDGSSLTCYAHKNTSQPKELHLSCYSPLCRERIKLLSRVQNLCGEASEIALERKVQNMQYQTHRNRNRLESLDVEIARLKQELSNITRQLNQSLSSTTSGLYKLSSKKISIANEAQETDNHICNLDIFSLPSKGLEVLCKNPDFEVSAPQVGMSGCYAQKNATSAHYWPYFCDRPTNKFSWRHKIRSALEQQNLSSKENLDCPDQNAGKVCVLASTALCIKLLHACVRWDELRELKSLNSAQIPGVTFINKGFAYRLELENGSAIIKEPQNIRDIPPDNVETEFLMRIVELPKDSGERAIVNNYLKNSSKHVTGTVSPGNRKGPRTRRSARTPKFKESFLSNTERSVEVRWIPETELQLWEVKYLLDRRDAIISKHEQDKLKKERDAKRKALILQTGADFDHKPAIGACSNKQEVPENDSSGVKEERDSEETKDSTDSENLQTTKKTVEVKGAFPTTPSMKSNAKVVVLRVGDGKQFILNSTPTLSGFSKEMGKDQTLNPNITAARIRVIPASLVTQSLASNKTNSPNCFRVISSPQKTNIVPTPGTYPQVMQLVSTSNSEKKYILKTQLPVSSSGVKVAKPENQSFSANGYTESSKNGLGSVIQVHSNPKPAYHKLNSVAETLPANLRPSTPRESRSRRCCKTKTKSEFVPSQSSPKGGISEFNETCINNYNALTKRLSNRCSDMAARAYKAQVLRKRDLMREQIDLELMFHDKKVPLTRQIYEMPYTAIIQHQLLPEDDNDPNISFPSSCSSESDHDLTPERSTTAGVSSKSKSNKQTVGANLITVGKRSAMSKQMQEKNDMKRKNRGEKRKMSQNKSESDADGKTSDSDSKFLSASLKTSEIVRENKGMKPVVKKSRKVATAPPTMQKGCQLKFGDRETLHCVCRTPYDYTKFYLKCDLCLKWFHGKCVGIDGRSAKKLSEFLCPSCTKNSNKDELYCVCKTPYDDSQFYIGCDECGDWFHGSCVGIDNEEAQNIDTYFCPQCKSTGCAPEETNFSFSLEDEHFELLLELMTVLMAHTHSWPFVEPSTSAEYPGYSEVVTSPICFKDIVNKVKTRRYKYFSEFHSDINRVFENARSFHRRGSSEFLCCDIVEKELVTFLTSFRQSIAQNEDSEEET